MMGTLGQVVEEMDENATTSYLVFCQSERDMGVLRTVFGSDVEWASFGDMEKFIDVLERVENGRLRVMAVQSGREYGFRLYPQPWVTLQVKFACEVTYAQKVQGEARVYRENRK